MVPELLSPREKVLVRFARKMTEFPADMNDGDVAALRAAGLVDEEVLMATLTAAYFNFVNRVVHTLGVELEAQQATYKY